MNLKLFISRPAFLMKILITLLLMLFLVAAMQGIIILLSDTFIFNDQVGKDYSVCSEDEQIDQKLRIIKYSKQFFMSDGTLHLVKNVYDESGHITRPKQVKIYDANMTLIWEGLEKEKPYEYLSWPDPTGWSQSISEKQINNMNVVSPDLTYTLEICVFADKNITEIWRYSYQNHYFKLYEHTTGKQIGYFGINGFVGNKSQVKPLEKPRWLTAWCPKDSINPIMLWQGDREVLQIDFENRTVDVIFESRDSPIVGEIFLQNLRFPEKQLDGKMVYGPAIFCRTQDKKLHMIRRQPEQCLSVSIPEHWNDYGKLTATDKGIYLLRSERDDMVLERYNYRGKIFERRSRLQEDKPVNHLTELYSVDEKGNLKLMNQFEWQVPPISKSPFNPDMRRSLVLIYVTCVSSPIYNLLNWFFDRPLFWYLMTSSDDNFLESFIGIIAGLHPRHIVLNWFFSLIAAFFTLWHAWARRTSTVKLIAWLAFVAVFGIAGFLVYLGLNHTSVIICPACGKKRGIGITECIRCGSELPRPIPRDVDRILEAAC